MLQNLAAEHHPSFRIVSTLSSMLLIKGAYFVPRSESFIFDPNSNEPPNDLVDLQNMLLQCGAVDFFMNKVADFDVYAYQHNKGMKELYRDTLRFANCLTCYGNAKVQESIIYRYNRSWEVNDKAKRFLSKIREILRFTKLNISKEEVDKELLDLTVLVLVFINNLCEGNNMQAKNFVQNQHTRQNVDLVIELANLAIAFGERFQFDFKYID
mmetsp:Transcript_7993/g.4209  ORF Transcript_7993/g.4209 Transcript_7993/m.4209 type:complete len:212 (-) Transcript_7993:1317-1952(-)